MEAVRILVVEDSETQALRLTYLLENEGWEVTCTSTAESAMEELNRRLPSLIIADHHLPRMRGDELCRRIRINVQTRGIPILMLTSEESQGSEQAGLDSGADDYVGKSVPSDILILRVRALLRKRGERAGIGGAQEAAFRRAHLLAIDDSPTYLEYLAGAMSEEGYEVAKAQRGEDGIEHMARDTFDCVLVDLIMPRMDGIEVCRRITEINRRQIERHPAAVIMLTSSESEVDMTRSLEAGADDFVGKSSEIAVLKARIRALLRRKFFQEDNQRIIEELRYKEMEAVRSRAEKEAELNRALTAAYDELQRSQENTLQQERLRALGQMSSGVAHDINNAISPASLYVEALLEREQNLSARAREYLEIIQRAIGDVAHTVGRMREFYRGSEPARMPGAVELNEVARQVIDLTRVRWSDMPQQSGAVIDVRMELSAGSGAIAGIESEIREALTNLVFNAVDAMPDGGALTLRTSVAPSGHVQIEVMDTGTGMDEEARRRCLEPFFTTKGERGTGLGLAMVYGTVRRHNAEIEIDSVVGIGSTFRLKFPAAEPVTAVPEKPVFDASSRLRILLVDDDPRLIDSLRDVMADDGHEVIPATGGQQALDLLRGADQRFDAVVTDLGMPHVDGRAVAQAAKAASPETRVILLTGWGQKLLDEGEIPPGVDQVLVKPPKMRDLREALALCPAVCKL